MDISGEYIIAASRETVWHHLNNPETLKACIPGCESLEPVGDDGFTAKVVLKIGPVKANFAGEVTLSDKIYPESYRISGEGKGGIAGFAKGGANVTLEEVDEGTKLIYSADAKIGGKIAQLGSRLIDSTAKKLADQFFGSFSETVSSSSEA